MVQLVTSALAVFINLVRVTNCFLKYIDRKLLKMSLSENEKKLLLIF
jgi:hypothetical protein